MGWKIRSEKQIAAEPAKRLLTISDWHGRFFFKLYSALNGISIKFTNFAADRQDLLRSIQGGMAMKRRERLIIIFLAMMVCIFPLSQAIFAQSAQDVFGETSKKISAGSDSTGTEATGMGTRTGTVVVNPYLNVRNGPWGAIIGALYNGNTVEIIGSNGAWYHINYGSGTAWVHSDYVRLNSGAAPAPASQVGTVRVNPSLNIRNAPWGAVIGSLYDGNKVNIVGKEGDWYKISLNGSIVYCHSAYITVSGSSQPSAPPAGNTAGGVQTGANGKTVLSVPQQCQGAVSCPVPWSACGPTSLGMALAYHNKQNPGALAAKLWYTCGTTGNAGTNHAGMVRGAQQNGFPNARWHYSVGLSWVKEQIRAGKPVIANVYNHYVVITGVDDSGNIYYNDPAKWQVPQVKSFAAFSSWWNGGGCHHAAMTLQ